jgi:hypothetical protein
MDVRMTPLRDGWLPVTHDSTSLEQSSVPSGPFKIDRHCVPDFDDSSPWDGERNVSNGQAEGWQCGTISEIHVPGNDYFLVMVYTPSQDSGGCSVISVERFTNRSVR